MDSLQPADKNQGDTVPPKETETNHKYLSKQSQSPLQGLHDRHLEVSPLRRVSPCTITSPVRANGLEDIREEDNEDDPVQSTHNPPPCTTFNFLPSHTTPPSRQNMVRNPFDAALIKRLHLPIFSPNVFKKVVSPSQEMRQFCWTIEDVAKIRPAPIEEHQPQQYEHYVDPETELKAQQAIDHYFCNTHIGSSPWGPQPSSETSPLFVDTDDSYDSHKQTPLSSDNAMGAISAQINISCAKKEVSTQTMLSLPPQLPPALETALKPYFTFVQDQCDGAEEINLSTSTLRRKLFDHDEDNHQMSLSPVRSSCFSMQVECKLNSPTHSGLLLASSRVLCPSAPVINNRTYGTPLPASHHVSSPEVSPIANITTVQQRNKSVTRLNFNGRLMALEKTTRSSSVSSLGLMPIQHEDDNFSMQEPRQWTQGMDAVSVSGSSTAMITSGNCTPMKDDSGSDTSSSVMITSETTTPVKPRFQSFNEDVSMERARFSQIKTKLKELESTNNFTVEDDMVNANSFSLHSTAEIEGGNIHSQDTGYHTESISYNMTNLHTGAASSAFASLSSLSRNWSSVQFKSLGEKQVNEGLYGEKCNLAIKSSSLMIEDNSIWLPSSKHIVSSTPTKSTS